MIILWIIVGEFEPNKFEFPILKKFTGEKTEICFSVNQPTLLDYSTVTVTIPTIVSNYQLSLDNKSLLCKNILIRGHMVSNCRALLVIKILKFPNDEIWSLVH